MSENSVRIRNQEEQRTMTVKEVAEVLNVDIRTIQRYIKDLDIGVEVINGKPSYLNEPQVTAIKLQLQKNSSLPKTNLEKELIIQQAIMFQTEKIEKLQNEIEHKTEVISGFTETLTIFEKREIINRVVKRGGNIPLRYQELYKIFQETFHISLPSRCYGYNIKQNMKKAELSVIGYAEEFGYINDLYIVACKVFETDVKEILEKLGHIINDKYISHDLELFD